MTYKTALLLFAFALVGCGGGSKPTDLPMIQKSGTMELCEDSPSLSNYTIPERISLEENTYHYVDLDSDGSMEKIEMKQEGVFLNDVWQCNPWGSIKCPKEFWIVDVDTNDSYLNMIFSGSEKLEVMAWWKDGTLNIWEYEGFTGATLRNAHYYGNGAITVDDFCIPFFETRYVPVTLIWNCESGIVNLPCEVELKDSEYQNKWTVREEMQLFQEDGSSLTVLKGQSIIPKRLVFNPKVDDLYNWLEVSLDEERSAWLYFHTQDGRCIINGLYDALELIDGLSNAG